MSSDQTLVHNVSIEGTLISSLSLSIHICELYASVVQLFKPPLIGHALEAVLMTKLWLKHVLVLLLVNGHLNVNASMRST